MKLQKLMLAAAIFATSSVSYAEHQSSIYIKTGSFTMATKNQTIVNSVAFDTTSTSIFSIEYERKLRNNMSWGGELISYENTYASGAGTATSTHVMFNFRKSFDVTKHFQPFVGAGLSGSSVSLSGIGQGSGGGLGFQAMAGFRVPFEEVSLIAEYKIISAKPDDDAGSSVDISGRGLFFGVGMNF